MKKTSQKILDPIDGTKHDINSHQAGEVHADSYDDTQLPTEITNLIRQRVSDDEGSEDFNGDTASADEEVVSLETMADEENSDIMETGDDSNE